MTKDQVKAYAKQYGMKVRESFMDDLTENIIILATGIAIGIALVKFHLL